MENHGGMRIDDRGVVEVGVQIQASRWGAFATRSRTTLGAATCLLNTTIKRLFDECTQVAMKGLAVTEMGDVFTADDYQRVLGAWGIMRDSMARDMQQNHPTEADHFLEK